jgi:hypothetical protein
VWLFILGAKKEIVSLRLYFSWTHAISSIFCNYLWMYGGQLSNPPSIEEFAGLSRLGSLAEKLFPFQEAAAPPSRFQVDWRLEKKGVSVLSLGYPQIIHVRIYPYKPSILGTPFMETAISIFHKKTEEIATVRRFPPSNGQV